MAPVDHLKTVLELAHTWLVHAKLEKEQRSARGLVQAGVLLAALHTLDNRLRGVFAELNMLDPDASAEERRKAIRPINEVANDEKVLPVVRQFKKQLDDLRLEMPADDWDCVDEILFCARGLLISLGDSEVTPFADNVGLSMFIADVKDASTAIEIIRIRQEAVRLGGVVERKALAHADAAFGRLKTQILRRHPSLPEPQWTSSVLLTA